MSTKKTGTAAGTAYLATARLANTLHARWVIVLTLEGHGNDAVGAALAADDLPCPSDDVLDTLRAARPKGFRLASTKHAALLDGLGIGVFLRGAPEAEQALAILRRPRCREMVEAGLVVGVPSKAIAQTLALHLEEEVTPASIELYKDVFFDVAAVGRAQLCVLVHERVRLAVMRMVRDPEDEVAARRAIDADARSVAITLPATPIAWSSVLISLGFSPGRRELVDYIAQMETLATVRASEALLRGGPDDERRAEGFIAVLQKIQQIKETVITPDSELVKKLTALRVKHEVKPVLTMAELRSRGDDVTVDMGPPLAEEETGT